MADYSRCRCGWRRGRCPRRLHIHAGGGRRCSCCGSRCRWVGFDSYQIAHRMPMVDGLRSANAGVAGEIRIRRWLVVAHLMARWTGAVVFRRKCRIRVPIQFRLMMAHWQRVGILAVGLVIANLRTAGAHGVEARLAGFWIRWISVGMREEDQH